MKNLSQVTLDDVIDSTFKSRIGSAFSGVSEKERLVHSEQLKVWFSTYFGGKEEQGLQKKILKTKLSVIKVKPDEFIADIISGIRCYPKDKNQAVLRIEHCLKYIHKEYGISFDLKPLENFKCKSQEERLLRMLRHLHSGDHSRVEIAETFGISERQLSEDLKVLQNGFEFLDVSMEISNLERGTNTYSSTIHPIFLSMNMSEIFAMTVGLKLLSKGTLWESTLRGISDMVYQQISDYAQNIICHHTDQNEIGFGDKALRFVGTNRMMDEEVRPFIYFLKESQACEITFWQEGKKRVVCGEISFVYEVPGQPLKDKIRIISKEDHEQEYVVRIDDVERIRKLE